MITNKSAIITKLPNVGTTIFTVMSSLANEYNAINLSQGFPNFPVSDELISLVNQNMKKGYNQYAPMMGIKELREVISEKTYNLYNVKYNPDSEITVTSGGTEAIFDAITAVVKTNDEVIVFEPAYDCYVPAIELNGGIPVYVSLKYPDYKIDWNEAKNKITPKTKLIIVNTPHNPTGAVLDENDLKQLANIVQNTNIFIISDEVYEHIIFDGLKHNSLITVPELQQRSFIVSSFGKTFHATGWKTGYCVAPKELTTEFRKMHQFITFSTFTPLQYALAEFLKNPANYNGLPKFYEKKRNIFLNSIKNSKFTFVPSKGSYFQNLCYSEISDEPDYDLAIRLTKEIGVASVPLSAFYHDKKDEKTLRFCFAKDDETLNRAGERLAKL
ncbi:MAG: methionine aminotransferase [Bacteroidetes bacterium CG02_land_8_20_14_3_00_31_25]|nr:MAG: methionine aminotransferase [Bacteroidetes bacterium CG02_land_8_20_14_3_00_31_25]